MPQPTAPFNKSQSKANPVPPKYEATFQSYSQTHVQVRGEVSHITDVGTKCEFQLQAQSGFVLGNGGEIR
jgi:hypothetical protein